MARKSYASSGVSTSPEQQYYVNEHFQVLQTALGATLQTRLQQNRRWLTIRDYDTFVSTAIAPRRWIAAATSSEVRLYDVDNQNSTNDIKPCASFRLKLLSKNEGIRAVAISNDLLAVVTHLRLLVYEYQEPGNIENNILDNIQIDQKASWNPRSVSILQIDSADTHQSAAAWIAVGGEGVNGVKLYQYSKQACWNALRDCRLNLKSPQNTGLVQSVGFSTYVHMNCFVVFAVTSENRIVCWNVRSRETGSPVLVSQTEYDANVMQNPSQRKGGIAAVSIFKSPSGIAYMLVAIDQKHGSQAARSFIAPLNTLSSQRRTLPEKIVGRYLTSAVATPNGRFLVVVEQGAIKLLTLRGALEGGLTCLEHALEWPSSLKETAKDVSAISLLAKESLGCIEITGVDGRGHLVSARVSVPGMPVTTSPSLTRRSLLEAIELPSDAIMPELCGKELSPGTEDDSTARSEWERVSAEIEDMLAG